mmetsp:Transcript_12805/g.34464  ORF Transcript_12805/g.34464 Transcript_12805/m.34464 type:complete len:174 (-) Transcript_12805:275-796(-)
MLAVVSSTSGRDPAVAAAASVAPQRELVELFVIYDADGTVAGELVYLLGKWLLGRRQCAACSITHGPRREKPEFTDWKLSLGVPVSNIHRDEMHIELYNATRSRAFPCVVGRVSQHGPAAAADAPTAAEDQYVYIMDPHELDLCDGDLALFQAMLERKLRHLSEPSAANFRHS